MNLKKHWNDRRREKTHIASIKNPTKINQQHFYLSRLQNGIKSSRSLLPQRAASDESSWFVSETEHMRPRREPCFFVAASFIAWKWVKNVSNKKHFDIFLMCLSLRFEFGEPPQNTLKK